MNKELIREIEEKKAQLDLIGDVLDFLEEKRKDATCRYQVVGKRDEQATDWRTGELLWEDEEQTIPVYRDIWDHVEIPEEDWTEQERAKVLAIDNMTLKVQKLI